MSKKFPGSEVKVSIAAPGIQEVSAYHHGDISGVLVNMAQNFTGANNLPYLEAIGQFGSRLSPEASATRYIFTKLNQNFRKVFLKEDEDILEYLDDDGKSIEPKFYLPIIPNVLLNGSEGMGVGFASKVFSYKPADIIGACEDAIKGKKIRKLIPWYKGFTGTIDKQADQATFKGVLEVVNSTTIKISELPVGSYTVPYRAVLNKLEETGLINSYLDNSKEDRTEFIVKCKRETAALDPEVLLNKFKLISRDTENLTLWNDQDKLQVFDTVEDLVQWFVEFRLKKVEVRRLQLIERYQQDLEVLLERVRFIKFYLANSKWFSENKKESIIERLTKEKFKYVDELLSIRVYNLTLDEIQKLNETVDEKRKQLDEVQTTTNVKMYQNDLDAIKNVIKI
jgi:DNA topoisomerase-2